MSSSLPQLSTPVGAGGMVRRGSNQTWIVGVVAAAFGLLWFVVVNHLRMEWTINPQYSYGWTVPFLALYLFARRWPDRPLPAAPSWPWTASLLALLCLLPLLPARIVSVANPDWRLLSWALSLAGVIASLSALHLIGGRPWVRHFGFAIVFFLVATPWPAQIEQQIVLGLMRADAAIVVETLNAIGTIAVQRGNVIELTTGLVGIEDACTGVRSLQSTFMIALFLGEFYRMTAARRLLLVFLAAVLAFVCNLVRTLILCLVAAKSGTEGVHAWHDSAGFTILIICLVGLWLMSLWLVRGQPAVSASRAPQVPLPVQTRALRFASVLLVWMLLVEGSAAAWYHFRGPDLSKQPSWSAAWPVQANDYRVTEVPAAAKELLLYNEGGGATWRAADGRDWLMYYFRWLPGRTAALFVKNHRPDICLPASGLTMQGQSSLQTVAVHGVRLPYRTYRFQGPAQNLDVLYCYWDGRTSFSDDPSELTEDWSARGRLRNAWRARREIGARMLEVAVWGYEDEEKARAALLGKVQELVQRD